MVIQEASRQNAVRFCLVVQRSGRNDEADDGTSNIGLISRFVGMLTDSRSFLSYPRHDYFRRILCNYFGTLIEGGEYPDEIEFVGKIVQDICYYNAKKYFRF